MEAERGHSCYLLTLQPGRPPRVQPAQVLILDQLTAQSPQIGSVPHRGEICKTHPVFIFIFHILLKPQVWALLALMSMYLSVSDLIFSVEAVVT